MKKDFGEPALGKGEQNETQNRYTDFGFEVFKDCGLPNFCACEG